MDKTNMTITIIGGSGFLGTRLAKRLLAAGHVVRIADKRHSHAYPELWSRCDVRNRPEERNEFSESLTDADTAPGADAEAKGAQPMRSLMEVLEGSDVVVNLAAEHRDDVTPKSLYDDVNVRGSANVCAACTELGIRKIIFTSSVAVYGFAPPGTDESGGINYFNDYGRTKYAAEGKYREWLSHGEGNRAVIIRPTVIFGEGNRGNVYNLMRQIAGGKFPMVGKGTNRKSMNYVENVAAFIQYCAERDLEGTGSVGNSAGGPQGMGNECLFNYCDEPAYDMNRLVLDCYKALGRPKKRLFHFPFWLAYCGGLCFDLLAKILRRKFAISSIRVKKFCQDTYFTSSRVSQTGFVAPVSLEEGLRRTIDYEFVSKTQGHVFHCE